MNIDHEILAQNQIDALDNNQVTFILYQPGVGGEFLSWLISKYSSNNYFKLVRMKPKKDINRSFIITDFLFKYFLQKSTRLSKKDKNNLNHVPFSQAKSNKWIRHDFITVESVLFEQQYFLNPEPYIFKKGKMLEFDTHLNNKGRIIIPSHFIFTKYMNPSNTFYITVDEFKYLNYIKDLGFIKIDNYVKYFAYKEVVTVATKILMSQMFKKGYLEEMFNIKGDEFHKELIRWHRKNVRLVNEYRKRKNYEEKGISIPTL
jgi:hypothetical protein